MSRYLLKAKTERTAMTIAEVVSEQSKDTTKVGAVLISKTGHIVMNAYNGPPSRLIDSPDKFVRPDKYKYAAHAEENLISFCARHGISTDGTVVVCTHHPCASCMRKMLAAGIRGCVYGLRTFQALEEDRAFVNTMVRESGFSLYAYNPLG